MAEQVGPHFVDTWSCTMSNTIKLSHKWTINNFSFYWQKPRGEFIESLTFSPKGNRELIWCLRAYPSYEKNDRDYFAIELCCKTSNISNMMAKFKIYFIDVTNSRKNLREASSRPFTTCKCWGFYDFIEKQLLLSEASVLLPNDKLTIVCEMEIIDGIADISGERQLLQVETSRMNNDFLLFFESHRFSDVTLAVSGKDIQAHKMILAARSPVFSAMFEHDMQELSSNQVKINDVEYDVFMELLHFIYTDRAPNLESMAIDLLKAADKYGLDRLKSMCAEALYKGLDINSVVGILVVSHLHNANELKALAINFVCEHTKCVTATATFKSMARSYPDLMIEILHAISTRQIESMSITAEKK